MADRKISQATERTTLDGTEQFPIGYNSNPFKVLISTVKDYVISFFTNKTVLDKLSDTAGRLQYDSKFICYPFIEITDGPVISMTVLGGTNCILNTTETDIEIQISNQYNGLFGVLIINNSATLNLTLPTSFSNGVFTGLIAGTYIICWTYDGTELYFNIKKYTSNETS